MPWYEVIGVVQNIHLDGVMRIHRAACTGPCSSEIDSRSPDVTFVIRSERAGTASLASEVRQTIAEVNGRLPITLEGTMQGLYAESLARTSFTLVMLAIAGTMALALGVIGIYGVIAYVVQQRTREIGIRSALGAEPRELAKMFCGTGSRSARWVP
jgi:ABC-type antimicrobial peptide transport system permease subunit